MPGLAELALGTAPIAGGALLGLIVGNGRGPDVRAGIKADMDLLDRLPAEDTERRAALQGAIDVRIDDIVATPYDGLGPPVIEDAGPGAAPGDFEIEVPGGYELARV